MGICSPCQALLAVGSQDRGDALVHLAQVTLGAEEGPMLCAAADTAANPSAAMASLGTRAVPIPGQGSSDLPGVSQ